MQIANIAVESLDKGKPFERAGRKTIGLNPLRIKRGDGSEVTGRGGTIQSADSATG